MSSAKTNGLTELGVYPRFLHIRIPGFWWPGAEGQVPDIMKPHMQRIGSAGGITICGLFSEEDGKLQSVGVAFCSPKDTFSKRKGRNIAMGRAKAAYEMKALVFIPYATYVVGTHNHVPWDTWCRWLNNCPWDPFDEMYVIGEAKDPWAKNDLVLDYPAQLSEWILSKYVAPPLEEDK